MRVLQARIPPAQQGYPPGLLQEQQLQQQGQYLGTLVSQWIQCLLNLGVGGVLLGIGCSEPPRISSSSGSSSRSGCSRGGGALQQQPQLCSLTGGAWRQRGRVHGVPAAAIQAIPAVQTVQCGSSSSGGTA
jgi:hypothetical protein